MNIDYAGADVNNELYILVFFNYQQEDEIINSPQPCTSLECSTYRTPRDGKIDIMRWKRDTDIQYRHEKKEDVMGFIPKLIA